VILLYIFQCTQSERIDHIERIVGFALVLEIQQAESFSSGQVGQDEMNAEIERHPLCIARGGT
jgi:hypothetical protein